MAPSPMRERSQLAKRPGLFAGLAVATSAFQLLMIAATVLRPEIDPAHNPISEYAIGRLGWLAVLGFQATAPAYASLAAALRHRLPSRLRPDGLFMLCYCALATAVVGLCVADPVRTPMSELTAMGRVHLTAGISAFVVLPVAAVAINISLSRAVAWAESRKLLIVTGLLPTIGFGTLVTLVATVTPAEGWPPRLMFLTYAAWTIAIAIKSVGLSRHRVPELVRTGRAREEMERSRPETVGLSVAYNRRTRKSSKEIREAVSDRGRGVRSRGERPPTRGAPMRREPRS